MGHNPVTLDVISSIQNKETIQGHTALLKTIDVKTATNGKNYAFLEFLGQNCSFKAKMWNVTKEVEDTLNVIKDSKAVVTLELTREDYKGVLGFIVIVTAINTELQHDNIYRISRVLDLEEFHILRYIAMIKDTDIQLVCLNLWEKYKDKIEVHPAGKVIHHDFEGGLFEHTIEVISYGLSLMMGEFSPYQRQFTDKQIDRFICMALFHDSGKIFEMEDDGNYTLLGKAYGHLYISSTLFLEALKESDIKLSEEDTVIINNGILSHHLTNEWGAIKPPISLEAHVLHVADMHSMHVSKFIGYALNPLELSEEGLMEDKMIKHSYYIDTEMKKFVERR